MREHYYYYHNLTAAAAAAVRLEPHVKPVGLRSKRLELEPHVCTMRRICGSNPMSSMRSASSRTFFDFFC
jgi:hypothetical protein